RSLSNSHSWQNRARTSELSSFGPSTREFEPFDHVVDEIRRSTRISKQKLRKIEGVELIPFKRDQCDQTLCFTSRPFVLCGLPVRRLPMNQLLYERRNW